jgi:hypothetical protein
MIDENCSFHNEAIPKTPLLNEVFIDFDIFCKQLHNKQKNGKLRTKKQNFFDAEDVASEKETKKVFKIYYPLSKNQIQMNQ